MRVLVILLSGQHVPNLLSVEAFKPDLVAYVETDDMKRIEAWNNLRKALEIKDLSFEHKAFHLSNDNSLRAIMRLFGDIQDRYKDEELIVNVTGGTKLMAIGAFEVFRKTNARIIYKPFRYVDEFIDLENDSSIETKGGLSVRQFLKGYGYDISETDEEIEERHRKYSSFFEMASYLAENFRHSTISGCLSNLMRINDGSDSGKLNIDVSDGLRTNDPILKRFLIAYLGMDSLESDELHGTLDRNIVRFLTGEWLEIFIWGVLREYGHLVDVSEPMHSVTILKKNEPGVVKNELDVAFLKDNNLCIMECKTGKQMMDRDAQKTIYKFKAVIDQFKALSTSQYLVTTSDNLLDGDGEVKNYIASRLAEYDIKLVKDLDIQNLANAVKKKDEIRIHPILREILGN